MILQVDHLDVGYGAIKALHGVSLSINRGEIVALIGSERPSGAWDGSHGCSVTAATPPAKPVAMKTFPIRPKGARDCSHGWSVMTAQPADAEPVELDASLSRPGGAKEA